MGIAIIGVKINQKMIPRLKKQVKEKAFNHDYPETENFDSRSGKSLWTGKIIEVYSEEPKYIFSASYYFDKYFDENKNDGIYEQSFINDKLSKKLIAPYEGQIKCWDYNEKYFLGLICSEKEMFKVIPPDVKEFLKKFLEPYDLWNENNYGLYNIPDL